MAWVRVRVRSGIPHYYVIDGKDCRAAGSGKLARSEAHAAAAEINRIRRRHRLGLPVEDAGGCRWTLENLHRRDMADAKSRGLTSLIRRESHWTQILEGFGPTTRLDQVTPAAIDRYARARMAAGVGPAVVNRDLRSVLSPALKFARRLKEESGFTGRPFDDLPQLEERSARRKPMPLSKGSAEKVIAEAWRLARGAPRRWRREWHEDAVIVELWLTTASRRAEILALRKDQVAGNVLAFPGQKRGKSRAFDLRGPQGARIRALLASLPPNRSPWVFPSKTGEGHRDGLRAFWRRLVARSRVPGLHPHDLRHTTSRLALKQGRGVAGVQGLLGHSTPAATDRVYLELHPELLQPVEYRWPRSGRATGKNSKASRKTL